MDNFENIQKFSSIIFDRVESNRLEYVDAIVSYCEEQELDIDSIVSLISPSLKQKMEEEAIQLNLIKSSTHQLSF